MAHPPKGYGQLNATLPLKLLRTVKAAAAEKGLSPSEYVERKLSIRHTVIRGPLIPAPREPPE